MTHLGQWIHAGRGTPLSIGERGTRPKWEFDCMLWRRGRRGRALCFYYKVLGEGGGVVSSGHHTDRRVKMTLTKKRNILPLQSRFAACMTARIYATAALILAAAAACGSRGQVDGA